MPELKQIEIGPQPGPQTDFLMSPADIAFYGGAAGGGKTYGILLEPLRHINNAEFRAVIFRRQSVQIRNEGGLWDESLRLYNPCGGYPREQALDWQFPAGMRIKFAHLENDKSVYEWQGAQIPFIGFDELTHFTEKQFIYMLSRNRSTSGVPGYIRATTNPDADSWVKRWIEWYLDSNGFPIRERSGVIRWFVRVNDQMHWGASKEEMVERFGESTGKFAKSFTFVPSKIEDNKILMEKDPSYLANLNALSMVERARLLEGNWKIRHTAGTLFRREWFPIVDAIPAGWSGCIRFWDRAATAPNTQNPDPDWTRGLKLYRYPDGRFLVADIKSIRDTPAKVEALIKNVASHDSVSCRIMSQIDPGSAGKSEADHFVKMLAGYDVKVLAMSKDKVTRAKPVSAQCEVGNVYVLRAPWNDEFFTELENFPDGAHDDQVDTLSGAFNELSQASSILDVI